MLCVLIRIPSSRHSNEHTQYTILIIKKKIFLDYSKSAAMGFFLGTQEQVQNSRGKRAISVRAIEFVLYIDKLELPVNRYFAYDHKRGCYMSCTVYR